MAIFPLLMDMLASGDATYFCRNVDECEPVNSHPPRVGMSQFPKWDGSCGCVTAVWEQDGTTSVFAFYSDMPEAVYTCVSEGFRAASCEHCALKRSSSSSYFLAG